MWGKHWNVSGPYYSHASTREGVDRTVFWDGVIVMAQPLSVNLPMWLIVENRDHQLPQNWTL